MGDVALQHLEPTTFSVPVLQEQHVQGDFCYVLKNLAGYVSVSQLKEKSLKAQKQWDC